MKPKLQKPYKNKIKKTKTRKTTKLKKCEKRSKKKGWWDLPVGHGEILGMECEKMREEEEEKLKVIYIYNDFNLIDLYNLKHYVTSFENRVR